MGRSWSHPPPTWSEKGLPCSRKTWSTTTTCAICVARVHSVGAQAAAVERRRTASAQDVDVPSVVLQSISTEVLMRAALDGMGVGCGARLLAQGTWRALSWCICCQGGSSPRHTVYAALPSGRMLPARTKGVSRLSERTGAGTGAATQAGAVLPWHRHRELMPNQTGSFQKRDQGMAKWFLPPGLKHCDRHGVGG